MLTIAWKNIWHKPLHTSLSLLLFSLGVGLVSFLLLINQQVQENFDKNLANIDMVLGAKGSPLQLILCSMYHIDNPTGNIKLDEAKPFLNPNHPLIGEAFPLSIGDSYQGFRIIGTTNNFHSLYNAQMLEGKIFDSPMEATIGFDVSKNNGLKVGDEFSSSHGLINDGLDNTHEDKFKVVGILKPSGAVIDQLILTPLESIWLLHHKHEGNENPEEEDNDEKTITSVLLKYRSRTNFQVLNLPRNINENTNMQAAVPAIEMNRLYALLGTGEKALRTIAIVIMIVSGISIFISLFNGLKERRYELALMRVMGASRKKLFLLIILEALILAFVGCFLGLILSHCSIILFDSYLKESFRYSFSGWRFLNEEGYLLIVGLLIGILAGLIPALMAYKTDISKTLSQN